MAGKFNGRKYHGIEGKEFGRWTAVEFVERKAGYDFWKLRCRCGTEKVYKMERVMNGDSTSCGCYREEIRHTLNLRHGGSKTPEYAVYKTMLARCSNKNNNRFARYGGRGIKVCDRWQGPEGFANFMADLGPRPSDKHSIEREDSDGHYEPGNVKWATAKEQMRNTSGNLDLEYRGETRCLSEWCEILGLKYDAVLQRIHRLKWPVAKAFETPMRKLPPRKKPALAVSEGVA